MLYQNIYILILIIVVIIVGLIYYLYNMVKDKTPPALNESNETIIQQNFQTVSSLSLVHLPTKHCTLRVKRGVFSLFLII
jgi:regulatory protein YycI of two-component signal transduction system YycFG